MSDNSLHSGDIRARIGDLLDRYPDIRPDERSDLLRFLTHGPIVDRGMIRGDAARATVLERVERDHPDHFRATLGSNLLVAALLIVPVVLMCWFAVYWAAK